MSNAIPVPFLLLAAALAQVPPNRTDTTGSQTIQPGEPYTTRPGGTHGRSSNPTGRNIPPGLPPPPGGGTAPTSAAAAKNYCPSGETQVDLFYSPPGASQVMAVCKTTDGDYEIAGLIRIIHEDTMPAFLDRAENDMKRIASVSEANGAVGWPFLVRLVSTLSTANTFVAIRHGGQASLSKTAPGGAAVLTPFTRPSTGNSNFSPNWIAATASGVTVRDSTGSTFFFSSLLKGTGSGQGSSVNYNPEFWPNTSVCSSGMTSDVALQHELLHAYRFASGTADNTPMTGGDFPVVEESWVVPREDYYRAARGIPLRKTYGNC